MTKERMIELIKAQIYEDEGAKARTAEEEEFLLKAWPDMTQEEKDVYRAVCAEEKGTLCNVVYSCNLEDLKATARTLEAIRTECTEISDTDEEADQEGSIEEILHAVEWAIRAKGQGGGAISTRAASRDRC